MEKCLLRRAESAEFVLFRSDFSVVLPDFRHNIAEFLIYIPNLAEKASGHFVVFRDIRHHARTAGLRFHYNTFVAAVYFS